MKDQQTIQSTDDRLGYSSSEVAEKLGCSEKHVKNLMKSGKIPSVKLGARRIVLDSDLRNALAGLRQHGWGNSDSAAA